MFENITDFFSSKKGRPYQRPMPSEIQAPRRKYSARTTRTMKRNGFPMGSLTSSIESARTDRLAASWSSIPTTPDAQIRLYWRILATRSRDLAINDPYMSRYVRSCRANIVGHGPQLRCSVKKANGTENKRLNDAVLQSWALWCDDAECCDVTAQQSFLDLTNAVVHSLVVDGEAFVKMVDGGPFGLQLQLLDAMRCPVEYDQEQTPNGTFIRSGIEFNQAGRPVAYLFQTDNSHGDYYGVNGQSYTRVFAKDVCHIYRKNMADQKRGLPWGTPSLYRLKNLKEFEDNAATNARVGASKMGVLSFKDGDVPESVDSDGGTDPTCFSAEGGEVLVVSGDATFQKFDPTFPEASYASFMKSGMRAVSSGLGVNYCSLANDLEGVNFSSIRTGTLEERELFKEDQRLLIEKFHRIVFKRWISAALLRGQVCSTSGYVPQGDALRPILMATTFIPRRWDWVDPKSDAIANQKAIESGLKSPQELIRERGRDPEQVVQETADWWQLCKAKGIPLEALQAAWGEQVKTAITDPTEEEPKK